MSGRQGHPNFRLLAQHRHLHEACGQHQAVHGLSLSLAVAWVGLVFGCFEGHGFEKKDTEELLPCSEFPGAPASSGCFVCWFGAVQ